MQAKKQGSSYLTRHKHTVKCLTLSQHSRNEGQQRSDGSYKTDMGLVSGVGREAAENSIKAAELRDWVHSEVEQVCDSW